MGLAQGFTALGRLWGGQLEGPLLPQGQIPRALFHLQQPLWMGPSLELRGAALSSGTLGRQVQTLLQPAKGVIGQEGKQRLHPALEK